MRSVGDGAATAVVFALCSTVTLAFVAPTTSRRPAAPRAAAQTRMAIATVDEEWDAIVVGSGIGGLSCAAILANAGKRVLVCEAHDRAGGVAHDYEVRGFTFENGPSLYAGLSPPASPNPLKHVFQIIGEEPEWLTYDRWGTAFPEGTFAAAVGARDFKERILPTYGGPNAAAQFERLMKRVEPLGAAIFGVPSAAVREDAFAALTLGRYGLSLATLLALGPAPALSRPFSEVLDKCGVTDKFLRNWLDMICFLLQGATTKEAPTTLMAYMLSDFYCDGVALDFPKGGTKSIIDALVRGVRTNGEVRLGAPVAKVLAKDGVAAGVELEGGETLRARVVVSNADVWTTRKLLPEHAKLRAYFDEQAARVTHCDSFLHLHVGIDAVGLPTEPSEALPAQWAALDDWDRGVDAPRNLVLVSMASMLDPSLAPEGCHAIHAYVPATEPFANWEQFVGEGGYQSKAYREAKEEAVGVLWRAIERYIPDVRKRVKVSLPATPLTHRRFNRRDWGSYGPFLPATAGQLMGHSTPLDGFYVCGDSTFPGIGVPAVAASGMITAHSILDVKTHWKNLDKLRIK